MSLRGGLLLFPTKQSSVIKYHDSVIGIDDRIKRLTEKGWRATLYEIITAISYVAKNFKPVLLKESKNSTLDILLPYNEPILIECKSRNYMPQKYINKIRNYSEFLNSAVNEDGRWSLPSTVRIACNLHLWCSRCDIAKSKLPTPKISEVFITNSQSLN
jgi:hypothetical protein